MTINYQFADCRHAVKFLLNVWQMCLQVVCWVSLQQQLPSEHATIQRRLKVLRPPRVWGFHFLDLHFFHFFPTLVDKTRVNMFTGPSPEFKPVSLSYELRDVYKRQWSFTCVADMPHRRRLRSASTDVLTCRRSTSYRRSCLSCCWSKGVEWPAQRCYVGLVAVGVQEQAEDILVQPLLRNCLTLNYISFS